MRAALDKSLRSQLEKTVQKAREIVETAVSEVLERLGIADSTAPSYLTDEERKLRNRLRAHGRQLGDVLQEGSQTTELLLNEMAYEHWHRMLFARFLEQNHLLMYDPQTPVTIDECNELAADEGFSDGWQLAAKLAEKMLPQIFKTGSPVFDVKLPINHIRALEQLISSLHPDTFQASDSLGWCYQFWQTKKKKEINDSGVKIGAQELSPVTQLFTEPYMVSFLLDNALGAWWAKRRLSQDDLTQAPSEQHLRELAAIDGVPLTYLRFVKVGVDGSATGQDQWQPAAGWFDAWPNELKDLKTLDPCCGSGHFLVALFLMLVPMRMQLESLSEREAIDAVLRDNLHGLELDLRCVDIAAFAVALEAWRYPNAGGYRPLPQLQIACSGLDVTAASKNWHKIANGNPELIAAMQWFSNNFKNAPILGSLIEPSISISDNPNSADGKPWRVILNAQYLDNNEDEIEIKVSSLGLANSAEIICGKYDWIITNVPFLGVRRQSEFLSEYLERNYFNSRHDLASAMTERILKFLNSRGVCSFVSPQTWHYQPSYKLFRDNIYKNYEISLSVRLGSGAFETISGEVVTVCLSNIGRIQNALPKKFYTLQLPSKSVLHKSEYLISSEGLYIDTPSSGVDNNELNVDSFERNKQIKDYADALAGMATGDSPRFYKCIWERPKDNDWNFILSSLDSKELFSGRTTMVLWQNENGDLKKFVDQMKHLNSAAQRWKTGHDALGKRGIAISRMGNISTSIYCGEFFDQNCAVIIPFDSKMLKSVVSFCLDSSYTEKLRIANPNLAISSSTVAKASFDLDYWQLLGDQLYSKGLPMAYSNNICQWLYHGHPCGSVVWDETTKWTAIAPRRTDDTVLQVAIARLLGYQWPAEQDPEMELAEEMRYWLQQNSVFDSLVDDDGIVCIPSVRGEKPAADRVEAILEKAFAEEWSANTLQKLLTAVGSTSLVQYLRDKFFEQHCKIFQNRPFIWQIWDGLKDGFSVLVNYHKLDYKGLERLIYTYLGDWIRTQEHGVKEGLDGADIRLTAAKNLETRLKAILEGEKGLDIFVRWKPLHEQPIGWNPDLNDGVRLNIRPFIKVADVGKKGAGVLRVAPKIDWKKDRGTDVPSAPWYHLGLEYGGKEGDRINDHHLSLAEKQAARAEFANKEMAND